MKDESSVDTFFYMKPDLRLIFDIFAEKILQYFPDTYLKVQKSQITFCGIRPFCLAWLPIRDGIKGRPQQYLIISFGLNREIIHPRLVDTTEPYPGRWTHHTILSTKEEVDEELMEWIDQAYRWKNGNEAEESKFHS